MSNRKLASGALSLCAMLALLLSWLPAARAQTSDTPAPKTVVVPGTLQSKLGCPGDWQPDCAKTALAYNKDKDVWEGTFTLPAGSYEYKVALNGTWAENYGLDGKRDGPNIPLKLDAETRVTFTYDHKTHAVTTDVGGEATTASGGAAAAGGPEFATIAGTLQSELGCSGDWQPTCDQTFLTYDAEDDVWQGTFTVQPGNDQDKKGPRYKVALNQGWDENYGLNAQPGGGDIPLIVTAPTEVKFYYDHKSKWVTDDVNSVIAVAAGDFQTALGCKANGDAGCLRSWLQDPEGDGTYVFITEALPAGTYSVQVALNESSAELVGAPQSFTVKAEGDPVYFGYNAGSEELLVSTEGAPRGNVQQTQAHWVSRDTILWKVAGSPGNRYSLHFSAEAGLSLAANGIAGGTEIPLTFVGGGPSAEIAARFPHLKGHTALRLPEAELAKVPDMFRGQVAVTALDPAGRVIDSTGLQLPGVLDDIYRYDGPLGVTWEGGAPALRVWAPTARAVGLLLYDDSTTGTNTGVAMSFDGASGVWSVTGDASWRNKYYLLSVQVYVPSTGRLEINLVTDPYSFSLSTNGRRSQFVDLDDPTLKPEGWDATAKPPLDAPEDIVLYELHVRDFSVNDATVPAAFRGTFKAFTVLDSNGMKHLRRLAEAGLTHVHLLPVFDIASVNEDKASWKTVDEAALAALPGDSEEQQAAVAAITGEDGFNWGYDPHHYTAPEGSYSTDPDGSARIREFRELVQALNSIGLRVVMDVVYNHTNASGLAEKSVLDKVVPGYYHRLNDRGEVERSTCCENTATEHRMMEKLMIDSVRTWATAYKVDGFRFDLMGHHMLGNIVNLRAALDSLAVATDGVDGRAVYVYGEGWNFGEVANNARGRNATQLNIGGSGIGVFNDRLRDGARGGGPFDPLPLQGFTTGLWHQPNAAESRAAAEQKARLLSYMSWIRIGLAGNLKEYIFPDGVAGVGISYNGAQAAYTRDPQENIVYVSAHDNETLWDAVQAKASEAASVQDRIRMHNIAMDLTMLAQGVPFFHAGDELLRSKSLDRNSYNSGDWFNRLDFTYQTNNWAVGLPPRGDNADKYPLIQPLLADPALRVSQADILGSLAHFETMLQVRKSSALFRLRTEAEVKRRMTFFNLGNDAVPGLIVYGLDNTGADRLSDPFDQIVVLFNGSPEPITWGDSAFAGGSFVLHPLLAASADAVVRQSAFEAASGAFTVPGRTTAVFVQARAQPAPTAAPAAATAPAAQAAATAPTGESPAPNATNVALVFGVMAAVLGGLWWFARRGMKA
jgi:pullulanase-type alpha-1,6-glucosidase